MEHHFLWVHRSQGESNIKPFPCHGYIIWWKCIFIGPSMVGAVEPSDYHIYGITQKWPDSWWRHQMETFSALLALCVGNSPVTGEFPSQRPVTRNFDVFFDLCLNKQLSKQSIEIHCYIYRVQVGLGAGWVDMYFIWYIILLWMIIVPVSFEPYVYWLE